MAGMADRLCCRKRETRSVMVMRSASYVDVQAVAFEEAGDLAHALIGGSLEARQAVLAMQPLVFAGRRVVIGQQVDAARAAQPHGKGRGLVQVALVVVDAGDDGDA